MLLLASTCLALSTSLGQPITASQTTENRSLNILLLDYSPSMASESSIGGAKAQTRWEWVQDHAKKWATTIPKDGTADVAVIIFDHTVPAQQEKGGGSLEFQKIGWGASAKAEFEAWMHQIEPPAQRLDDAALWNALGRAMSMIDSASTPYSHHWVQLVTDSSDTASAENPRTQWTYPSGVAGRERFIADWRKVTERKPSTYLLVENLNPIGAPLESMRRNANHRNIYTIHPDKETALRIVPSIEGDADFVSKSKQKLNLKLSVVGIDDAKLSGDASVDVQYEAYNGQVVRVDPARVPARSGLYEFELDAQGNDLERGQLILKQLGSETDLQLYGPMTVSVTPAAQKTKKEPVVEQSDASSPTGQSTSSTAEAMRGVAIDVLYGRRSYDKWSFDDYPSSFGMLFHIPSNEKGVGYEIGIIASPSASESNYDSGGYNAYALSVLELHAGLRIGVTELIRAAKTETASDKPLFNGYITMGGAFLKAETEYSIFGSYDVWDHTTFGWVLGAGLSSTHTQGFRWGIDYRQVLEAKLENNAFGFPSMLDYGQLGAFIGWSF